MFEERVCSGNVISWRRGSKGRPPVKVGCGLNCESDESHSATWRRYRYKSHEESVVPKLDEVVSGEPRACRSHVCNNGGCRKTLNKCSNRVPSMSCFLILDVPIHTIREVV